MMASAMMNETGPIGTVSDLAPTLTLGLKDDMWRLEAKGVESDVKKAGAGGGAGQVNQNFELLIFLLYLKRLTKLSIKKATSTL